MDFREWSTSVAPKWLAETVSVPATREDYSIIHIGAGKGDACLLLARRFPNLRIHGIGWNRDSVRQAAEHARNQNLQGHVEILYSDGIAPPPRLAAGTFDQAIVVWTGEEPPSVSEQMRMTLMMLKPQGILTMLLEPHWFTYMMNAWGHSVGNINLFPLWFEGHKTAQYVLVQSQKNTPGGLILHKGFSINLSARDAA